MFPIHGLDCLVHIWTFHLATRFYLNASKRIGKEKISEADGYILSLILWHLHLGTERIDLTELVPPVWKEKDFAESIQQWRKKLLEIGFF